MNPKSGRILQTNLATEIKYSMRTSSPSTEPTTLEYQSSQADFLASLSAQPGSDEARRMTVISGRKCSALLESVGHPSSLLKTCLESSTWNSTVCFLIWRASVIGTTGTQKDGAESSRLLFQLAPLTPDTDEVGFGFWPTPQAAAEAPNLNSNKKNGPRSLVQVAKEMWPTPKSRDWKGKSQRGGVPGNRDCLSNVVNGSLNPQFVEWLMGFPIDHTALDASEMPSSRKSSKSSHAPSVNN
jgi:hypothetical protein